MKRFLLEPVEEMIGIALIVCRRRYRVARRAGSESRLATLTVAAHLPSVLKREARGGMTSSVAVVSSCGHPPGTCRYASEEGVVCCACRRCEFHPGQYLQRALTCSCGAPEPLAVTTGTSAGMLER